MVARDLENCLYSLSVDEKQWPINVYEGRQENSRSLLDLINQEDVHKWNASPGQANGTKVAQERFK